MTLQTDLFKSKKQLLYDWLKQRTYAKTSEIIYIWGKENFTTRAEAIMCGQWAIPLCLDELKNTYIGIIALRNRNGMTFSPLGFGNWIPVIIAGEKPKSGQDCLSFNVDGYKPKHPSPKPLMAIKKLIIRLSEENDLIFDPFLGSGTTTVACKELDRKFIGIEISEEYFDIAVKRVKNTQKSMF